MAAASTPRPARSSAPAWVTSTWNPVDGQVSGARVVRVSGPLVEIDGLADVAMSELVALGAQGITGEVVSIRGTAVTLQACVFTGGLAAGDPVVALGHPLSARLGPELLGGVFDGLLRPLTGAPTWLVPDGNRHDLPSARAWLSAVTEVATVTAGGMLGTLAGSGGLEVRVMLPPGTSGRIDWLAPAGTYATMDRVAVVDGTPVCPTRHRGRRGLRQRHRDPQGGRCLG